MERVALGELNNKINRTQDEKVDIFIHYRQVPIYYKIFPGVGL